MTSLKDLFFVVLVFFGLSSSPMSSAQMRIEGNLDWVPRLDRRSQSKDVNHSLEFRPTLGLGLGKSFGAYRAGFLFKGGASLVSVGNNTNDYSLFRGLRGGYEIYIFRRNTVSLGREDFYLSLAFEQIWNDYRGLEVFEEKNIKLGLGGNLVWENSTLPIAFEFGFAFISAYLFPEPERSLGLYLQFSIF